MTFLRRSGGGSTASFRFLLPVVTVLFLIVFFSTVHAETPSFQVELRVTEEPSLQLLDNQGKIYQTLPKGTVRKKVSVSDTLFLASFGEDNQHHSILMLAPDISTDHPISFLFGKNLIVLSPEAIVTLRLSADRATALVNPSLMGQIWINGNLLGRGENRKLQLPLSKTTANGQVVPTPDQPKPTPKDFQSIPVPSI